MCNLSPNLRSLNISLEVPTLAVIENEGSGASELIQNLLEQKFLVEPYSPDRVLTVNIVHGESSVVIEKSKGEVAQKFSSLPEAADELQRRLSEPGERVDVTVASPSAAPLRIISVPPLSKKCPRTLKQAIAPASLVVVCLSPLKAEGIKTRDECEGECEDIMEKLAQNEKSVSKCIFVITQLDRAMALVDKSDKLQLALKGFTAKLNGKHIFAVGGDDSTLDGRITNAGLVQILPRPVRGLERVRDAVCRWAHGARQSSCRKLSTTLKTKCDLAKKQAEKAERETNGLHDPRYVRAAAADYIGQFIKSIEKLVNGVQRPGQYGMTVEQEDKLLGKWCYPCPEVAGASLPLHGVSQLGRTLAQFEAIMKETNENFSEIDIDIMSSKMREAACGAQELMKGKTKEIAERAVEQLIERAVFILKRLPVHSSIQVLASLGVAPRLQTRSALAEHLAMSSDAVLPQASRAPLFVTYVEEVFSQFVDELGERLRQKSKDNIECIGVTNWSKWDSSITVSGSSVADFLSESCESEREAFARNILLKCHHYLINPLITELPSYLNGTVSALSDAEISRLFSVESVAEGCTNAATSNKMLVDYFTKELSNLQPEFGCIFAPFDAENCIPIALK